MVFEEVSDIESKNYAHAFDHWKFFITQVFINITVIMKYLLHSPGNILNSWQYLE